MSTKTKIRRAIARKGRTAKPSRNGAHTLAAVPATLTAPPDTALRLDFGCGPNKRSDKPFVGVDKYPFAGVDVVHDVRDTPWPWADNSVDEAHASHFLEHLTNLNDKWERVKFFNELYRILKPEATVTLIFPHWCSTRFYGDPTHKEAFSEMGFYYLKRDWRLGDSAKGTPANAPHTDVTFDPNMYTCDFEVQWGNSLRPEWTNRNPEAQQFAGQWYKEVIQDLLATMVCKKG